MKQSTKILALALVLTMALGMLAACAPAAQPAADATAQPTDAPAQEGKFTPGTYTATGKGNNGDVTVSVTFSADAITEVTVGEHGETAGISDPAIERIPAAIVDGQTLAVDTVSGATNTSKAILAAVEDCVKQAGGDVEALKVADVVEETPVNTGANVTKWDKEVDLLVMGCGPAGISAAVEAVDNGCENVLIIEKTAMIGGTALLSEGILSGYETQLSKKYDVHITAQDCYDRMMMLSDYRNDPELTWVTAEKCGETIDWLIDVLKVPFVDEVVVNPTYGPLQMIHNVEGKGPGFLEPFQNALDSRGIEVMLETPGYKLIAGDNSEVIGAIATGKDGKDIRIKCKAVVLATGGFGNNAELVGRLMPLYQGCLPCAHVGATGDGLMMAAELGAAVVNADLFRGSLADYEIVNDYHVGGFPATIAYFMAGGGPIVVNKDGNRFTDEKQRKCNAFFSEMRKDGKDYLWAINDQKGFDEAKPERAAGTTYTSADTLEELAALMDIPAENLIATVERWNELCQKGVDEDFGRTVQLNTLDTPPYYCVKTAPGSMGNYGGLLRNKNSEVLRVDGTSIPGLYVAGGTAAVACENGWTMSHAFTYGRLAGRSSVEYMNTLSK